MSLTLSVSAASLRAQTDLAKSTRDLTKTYERLSSGQRLNSASDGAADLALADFLRSQSKLASIAIRNANEAVSLTSVADDTLGEIQNALFRMGELAEQSATGTYTNVQRSALQFEFEAIGSEIQRLASTTKFNDISLLSASSDTFVQVGFDSSENSRIRLGGVLGTLSSLNLASTDGFALTYSVIETSTDGAQSAARLALDAVEGAIGSISSRRGTIGAGQSRLESAINVLTISKENFTAAENGVRDADIAQEV
ncbi:MAG: hypothetical protein KDD62_08345, partial [Bdellovibrionales bacterium]|nr:hypothetical protein [Bdellovibrionales bacterium]